MLGNQSLWHCNSIPLQWKLLYWSQHHSKEGCDLLYNSENVFASNCSHTIWFGQYLLTKKMLYFMFKKVKCRLKVSWVLKCSVILSRYKAEKQEYRTESTTVSKLVPNLSISVYSTHLNLSKSEARVSNWSIATSKDYYKNTKDDKLKIYLLQQTKITSNQYLCQSPQDHPQVRWFTRRTHRTQQ